MTSRHGGRFCESSYTQLRTTALNPFHTLRAGALRDSVNGLQQLLFFSGVERTDGPSLRLGAEPAARQKEIKRYGGVRGRVLRASLRSHFAKLFCSAVPGAVLRRALRARSLRSLLLAYGTDRSATKSSYAQCFGRESLLDGVRFCGFVDFCRPRGTFCAQLAKPWWLCIFNGKHQRL